MSDIDDATVVTPIRSAGALTVSINGAANTAEPSDGPITIGRQFPAQIQIPDDRISRIHLRLQTEGGRWVAVDHSTNGTFLDGNRLRSVILTDGMTLHLGNAQGIPVQFGLAEPADTTNGPGPEIRDDAEDDADDESEDRTEESEVTDPGIARAGAAVAARRRELDIAQRVLAKDKIMNAGALISFEKGRSWPRKSTLSKLERVLGWEQGTISRIRSGSELDGGGSGDPSEQTVVLTNTVQAPLMVAAVEVALGAIRTQIEALPPPSDPEFSERAGPILADLRKLEQVAVNAARSTKGATEVALVLSTVRRAYRELMLRAAKAPGATFGQRFFAARHRAELSAEEAASAGGVPVAAITATEADAVVSSDESAALRALFASLPHR